MRRNSSTKQTTARLMKEVKSTGQEIPELTCCRKEAKPTTGFRFIDFSFEYDQSGEIFSPRNVESLLTCVFNDQSQSCYEYQKYTHFCKY